MLHFASLPVWDRTAVLSAALWIQAGSVQLDVDLRRYVRTELLPIARRPRTVFRPRQRLSRNVFIAPFDDRQEMNKAG
jgi:hypothetical protein